MCLSKASVKTAEELRAYENDALLQLWHEEACHMSYYNAAEGAQWGQEADGRRLCARRFAAVNQEIARRGLTQPKGNYLI